MTGTADIEYIIYDLSSNYCSVIEYQEGKVYYEWTAKIGSNYNPPLERYVLFILNKIRNTNLGKLAFYA